LLAAILLSVGTALAAERDIIDAVTAPSDEAKLVFNYPGIVKTIAVQKGDAVTAGQVLMTQDDDIERVELERLKAEADSNARVEFYYADLDVKQKVYDRKSKAGAGAFALSEIEEAAADVTKGKKQIDVAMLDHAGDKAKASQQELKIQKMQLRSPIDGIVQDVALHVGEYAQPDRGDKYAVYVVKNDPCFVEVRLLKIWQVARLKVGQTLDVKYPDESEWHPAKLRAIEPMAQVGTDRQSVRLEMPNAEHRATGVPIQVKLPAELLEPPVVDAAVK
jgi:RND family efflux transporter MFP subunit